MRKAAMTALIGGRAKSLILLICSEDEAQKLNGARGRVRTTDTAIFSRMLYQLSYPGRAFAVGAGPMTLLERRG